MRNIIPKMAACMVLVFISPAHGASDVQKCLIGRAHAQGKYRQCVEKWIAKGYLAGENVITRERLAKCLARYVDTWTKLQTLTESPICSLPRLVNNGMTVTDNLTGLVWEKKTTAVHSGENPADRHDVDNSYSWTSDDGDTSDEDGTAFSDFLTDLNAASGFEGANGWRLPTFAELLTIHSSEYPCATTPCIDPIFGPTLAREYYSSTTVILPTAVVARAVYFASGSEQARQMAKTSAIFVRAVRGGL